MDTIVRLLDDVFRGFPDTPEAARAKSDLLASMTDRFEALCDAGRSENEALGLVLAEFGSADELAAGLGLVRHEPKVPIRPDGLAQAPTAGRRSRSRRWLVAGVVAVVCVVASVPVVGGMIGFWLVWAPSEGVSPEPVVEHPVALPDVVGLTQDEATGLLMSLGFSVQVQQESSQTVPEGVVVRTDPSPGSLPDSGAIVALYVSGP